LNLIWNFETTSKKKGAITAKEGLKRRLSAILSADVVGYSRTMNEDEAHDH
jgi:class 3 adenylate cyclase